MYRNMRRTLRQLGAEQVARSLTGRGRPAIYRLMNRWAIWLSD
jgi:hypothetical protein